MKEEEHPYTQLEHEENLSFYQNPVAFQVARVALGEGPTSPVDQIPAQSIHEQERIEPAA